MVTNGSEPRRERRREEDGEEGEEEKDFSVQTTD